MAIVYADRVREQTTTVGTGTLTLLGAFVGHQTFGNGVGNGNETYYSIVDDTTNEWEVGRGTVGASTLSRDTVFASSNANALVNFGAGTKTVDAVASANFFTGALTTTDHNTLDHTGIPGVPAAESFDSAAHQGTDHTVAPWNLLDEPAHDALDHTGLTGVPAPEAFTSGVHATTDHTGLPGVPAERSERLRLFDRNGVRSQLWLPNPDTTGISDWLTADTNFSLPEQAAPASSIIHDFVQDATGDYARISGGSGGVRELHVWSKIWTRNAKLPRVVFDVALAWPGATVNWNGRLQLGFSQAGSTGSPTFDSSLEALWFEARYDNTGPLTFLVNRRIGGTLTTVDSGVSPPAGPSQIYHFVIEFTSATDVDLTIYSEDWSSVIYTTTLSGGSVPTLADERLGIGFVAGGDGTGTARIHGSYYAEAG